MALLLISPKFAPLEDGLGQHTKYLYLELQKIAKTVVLTSDGLGIEDEAKTHCWDGIFPVVQSWSFFNLLSSAKKLPLDEVKTVLVQYVPFLYSKRGGINFSLPLFLLYLRWIKGKKIHIYHHEVTHPIGWNPKVLTMFLCHHLMFYLTLLTFPKLSCSCLVMKHQIERALWGNIFGYKINTIPIGSNMSEFCDTNIVERGDFGIPENAVVLCHFGGFHISKMAHLSIEGFINGLSHEDDPFFFLFIGCSQSELEERLPRGLIGWKRSRFISTEFLKNEDVAKYFKISDYLLAPFSDGISTRRGSMMAALQNGCSVISTEGRWSDPILVECDGIYLYSLKNFSDEISSLIKGRKFPKYSRDDLSTFYQENFSWKNISQSIYDAD